MTQSRSKAGYLSMLKSLCQDGTDKVAICLPVGRQHTKASKRAFIKLSLLFTYFLCPKILPNYIKLLPTCDINESIAKRFF